MTKSQIRSNILHTVVGYFVILGFGTMIYKNYTMRSIKDIDTMINNTVVYTDDIATDKITEIDVIDYNAVKTVYYDTEHLFDFPPEGEPVDTESINTIINDNVDEEVVVYNTDGHIRPPNIETVDHHDASDSTIISEIKDIFKFIGRKHGDISQRIIMFESSGLVSARNGKHYGLCQLSWERFESDVAPSKEAFDAYINGSIKYQTRICKIVFDKVTIKTWDNKILNVYISHQQGSRGTEEIHDLIYHKKIMTDEVVKNVRNNISKRYRRDCHSDSKLHCQLIYVLAWARTLRRL